MPRDISHGAWHDLYDGFEADRQRLLDTFLHPDEVWDRAFKKIRRTDEYLYAAPETVAKATMRSLMQALDDED